MAWAASSRSERRDHYAEVSAKIVVALEAGTPPWRRDWDQSVAASMSGFALPCNGVTQRPYRGINRLVLGMDSRVLETGDPRFLSFDQAKDKGYRIRRGEKSSLVYFYKTLEFESVADDGKGDDKKRVPFLRAYPVFHATQIEGIGPWAAAKPREAPWRTPEAVQVIADRSGLAIEHHGDKAFYAPLRDKIVLPPMASFRAAEGYSAVLIHELGHSTAHPSRLNRWEALKNRFGSQMYAMEELRAELASAYACGAIGVNSSLGNHASYLASWIEVLKSDTKEIFRVAADAQKIADYVLEWHPEYSRAAESERQADAERQATRDAGKEHAQSREKLPPAHVATAARGMAAEAEMER